ncbi:crotonase/enoyl-CoA hydratase family protein [Piscinibacter sp. XHJ-5]|uniref:crotonase/enoyl-CoA hydratase family protein n=1 Tax=Piscinibacter sp. XHJ-5 TaxID=3037797 RepID=UPI0024536D3C|nr:crotonase/enoyl-CoA hydratase family protein [Piscinibacter sp. XHJ-5]
MAKWLASTECIRFDVADRVAHITLHRPDKRNTLTPQTLAELHAALLEADDRTDVNAIVLAGAGKDFCAGYDLAGAYAGQGMSEGPTYRSVNGTLDDDAWQLEQTQKQTIAMFDMHKPVIARVQGNCLAGGTDLALMCDMVIAADDARIGFPAARANGTPPQNMFVYHVGPQWAKRLLMTGDWISGTDAARIGLVMDSVPADELDAKVAELARRVAAVDAELLAAHKRVVNLALELSGARTMQRLGAELDARAHLSRGPRRTQFRADMAEHGLKTALKNRDEPFGDGQVRLGSESARKPA